MVTLEDMVTKHLKETGADSKTIELWGKMTEWFEVGGPDVVREGISKMANNIKSVARKQIRETKKAMPKKRKTRTRR
ncbi:hypothetical protein E3J62_07050 [candidate division TA06 bacterium]|uniref:Uncharacterized protein n=1 Tax=candidate division TA06 bacterium TaxID=2250710 RepID=A0A523USY8_UNCT6|nr:MAG: hypothetical protein E3J62_07050 [candidate division TA06 bacterium]